MSNQPGFSGSNQDPFSTNPYAPTVNVSETQAATDVEAYRRQYLSHEASVKSIGTLYLLGAIFLVPMGAFVTVAAIFGNNSDYAMVLVGVLYLAIGLLQGFAAVGLWRLQSWARGVAIVLSVIGLIGVPIGTLIAAYFLYLLLSQKGKIVFSDEYKQVIEQTPHIKYKTSIVVWIFLGLLLALIVLGIVGALVGAGN